MGVRILEDFGLFQHSIFTMLIVSLLVYLFGAGREAPPHRPTLHIHPEQLPGRLSGAARGGKASHVSAWAGWG